MRPGDWIWTTGPEGVLCFDGEGIKDGENNEIPGIDGGGILVISGLLISVIKCCFDWWECVTISWSMVAHWYIRRLFVQSVVVSDPASAVFMQRWERLWVVFDMKRCYRNSMN